MRVVVVVVVVAAAAAAAVVVVVVVVAFVALPPSLLLIARVVRAFRGIKWALMMSVIHPKTPPHPRFVVIIARARARRSLA